MRIPVFQLYPTPICKNANMTDIPPAGKPRAASELITYVPSTR
jgi:hypothetical protein